MSPTQLDPIAAVNPLTDDAAQRLALGAAEDDLLARIVASGERPEPAPSRAARRSRGVLAVAGLAVAALPVIAVLALVPTGRHSDRSPAPTSPSIDTGALRRFAGSSPLVLLQQAGWRVWYADEDSSLMGELDFKRAGESTGIGPSQAGGAELTWFPASQARGYIEDRASEAAVTATMPLLGSTAHLSQYKRAIEPRPSFTAIWTMGSRALMFEARARDMHAFRVQLVHLHVVANATWLKAMPASVIQTADRGETIRKMLKDIPLPPGFDARQIPGATLVRDRYQLGAAVTGTVACEWFARWGRARQAGDRTAVNQAIAAMATAAHWPVLKQMSHEGAWPSVLIGYAKAMRSGSWFGRPLLSDVNSGLGCSGQWHVKLGAPSPHA